MVTSEAKKRLPPPTPPPPPPPVGAVSRRRRRKKGRPSLVDLQKRALQQNPNPDPSPTSNFESATTSTSSRRVTRRNPHPPPSPPRENRSEEQEAPENEGSRGRGARRREKTLNHVLRSAGSASELSDAVPDGRKHDDDGNQKGEQSDAAEQMHSIPGIPLDSGPTTPLPGKDMLVLILDRLQRKDKYGVFSEPVDPDELPDYHETIEHPMDFGTVRKKLLDGAYANLECFEEDVFLISSNAMSYNSSDTIYYRQARSIQELAKKNFDNLRHKSDVIEPEPKTVPRRGRPPKKKKKFVSQPSDHAAIDFSSGAKLANADGTTIDIARKSSMRDKPWVDLSSKVCWNPLHSDSFDQMSEWKAERTEEYSGSAPKLVPEKYIKKHIIVDESHQSTYNQSPFSASGHESALLASFNSEKKYLAPVGLHLQYAYARSLARFAAKLGPIGWIVASKKIEMVLPFGAKFGPGWVGDDEAMQHSHLSLPSISPPHPSSKAPIPNCNIQSKSDKTPQSQQPVLDDPALKECNSDRPVSTLAAEVNQSKILPQLHQSRGMHSGSTGFTPAFIASQLEKMAGSTGILSIPFSDVQMTHGQVLDLVSRSNIGGGMRQQNAVTQRGTERKKITERSLMTSFGTSFPESSHDANEHLHSIPRMKPNPESVPSDINLGALSPGLPTSREIVDSQHSDLALQL